MITLALRLSADLLAVAAAVGGAPDSTQAVSGEPVWSQRPSRSQRLRAQLDATGAGKPVGESLTLTCRFSPEGVASDCAANELTAGQAEYARSAIALMSGHRAAARLADGRPLPDRLSFQFTFADDKLDSNPDWVKGPSLTQYMSAWPTEALRMRRDGRVTLICLVSAEGGLQQCKVAEETPPGAGFGLAAIRLSTAFRFKPAVLDGRPVESLVTVPIKFNTPQSLARPKTGSRLAGPGSSVTIMTSPVWASAPSRADMDAAYPARLRAQAVRGATTLECKLTATGTLTGCDAGTDVPRGMGFGLAAKSLAPRFQLASVAGREMASLKDARVRIPFQFDPPGSGSGDMGGVKIGGSDWASLPDETRMAALYPEAAAKAGIEEGQITLTCTIGGGGKLGGCVVKAESPANLGFGAAALAIADGFKVNAWTADGKPTDGARINLPIRYRGDATFSASAERAG